MSFDYASIPPGYYFYAMTEGCGPQQFWHLQKFLRVLRAIPGECRDLLDIACASGSLTHLAATERPELAITGVDISRDQIEFANQKIAPLAPHSTFLCIEPGPLPFPDHAFDAVSTIELVEHLTPAQTRNLIREIRRVLRPGGIWIATTPNSASLWPLLEFALELHSPVKYSHQHVSKFTPSSIRQLASEHSLAVKELETFFFISPFLTWISRHLAGRVLRWESRLPLPGSLILLAARKAV